MLRSAGWKGNIDCIEGCKEMVDVARAKNVYRYLYQQVITGDSQLPVQTNSYDLVLCVGGLSFGHLPHHCLEILVDLLVSGGLLAFNVSDYKNPGSDASYVESVLARMKSLHEKCHLVVVETTNIFPAGHKRADENLHATLYYYQRK